MLGNHPLINGRETEDRRDLALPEGQEALLRAVAGVRPETVLVTMSSYPYALDWADEHLPAVVWTSHGGQETGRALAAVLLGEADPAGPTSTTGPLRCTPSATGSPTQSSLTATCGSPLRRRPRTVRSTSR
ncbi:glycoside hydrolase family 3 protein [Nonomuraea sp. NPDC003201]